MEKKAKAEAKRARKTLRKQDGYVSPMPQFDEVWPAVERTY